MNLNFKTLQVEQTHKDILIITLNRPAVRNAINIDMMNELLQLWQLLCVNPHQLRCVIMTGAGNAFCAGADLKERKKYNFNNMESSTACFKKSYCGNVGMSYSHHQCC